MTQVKSYRIGTYELKNGKYVLKNHNRTYRKKPTKYVKSKNMQEAKITLAIMLLALATSMFIETTNHIDIQAEGKNEVILEPQTDYSGIPYMEATVTDLAVSEVASVEDQIRSIAKEKGFIYEDYLVRLADCESKLKPEAKRLNTDSRKTTDRRLFQINNYWHYEVSDECAYDLRCSTEWTIQRIEAGYQHEWMCDSIIKN